MVGGMLPTGPLFFPPSPSSNSTYSSNVAFLDGLVKELFPEIFDAFHEFAQTKNWKVVERAVDSGHQTAKQHARTFSSVYSEGKQSRGIEWAEKELGKRLLIPLGIGS